MTTPLPAPGDRVRLTVEVWRYPHFLVPAGATGTVVDMTDAVPEMFAVRLDEFVPGASEWDNEIHWILEYGDDPTGEIALLEEAPSSGDPFTDYKEDVIGRLHEGGMTSAATIFYTLVGHGARAAWEAGESAESFAARCLADPRESR